jgi:hypothetical protein
MNKHYEQWLTLRRRLHVEERAFAHARDAVRRGENADLELLSIQESEVRALRALCLSLARRVAEAGGRSGSQGRDGPTS